MRQRYVVTKQRRRVLLRSRKVDRVMLKVAWENTLHGTRMVAALAARKLAGPG